MPKTRKRANSPSPADISDDANGRFLNSQLLFYGFIRNNSRLHNKRSFSRNFSLVSGFCSCSSTSCSHSSWLKKEPLLLQVRSAAASQLNAFFPFFGLGFDEEKGQFFFFFKDVQRFHKTTTLRVSKIANRVSLCNTNTQERDDKSCQRLIRIIKMAELFLFNNFPYE